MIKLQPIIAPLRIASMLCLLIVSLTSALAATPSGQAAQTVGEYTLSSSSNEPANANWRYSKGWLNVRKLDDQHYLFLIACGWADSPRSQCNEWFVLQLRGNQLFMMDNASPITKIRFDPATHDLVILAEGVNGAKRLDVFSHSNAVTVRDPDLVRRMKAANKSWEAMKNTKIFKESTYTSDVMDLPR